MNMNPTLHLANDIVESFAWSNLEVLVKDRKTKQPIAGMWVTKDYNPLTHPRWTREGLQKEGDGVRIFRNAVEFARKNLI